MLIVEPRAQRRALCAARYDRHRTLLQQNRSAERSALRATTNTGPYRKKIVAQSELLWVFSSTWNLLILEHTCSRIEILEQPILSLCDQKRGNSNLIEPSSDQSVVGFLGT